MTSYCDLHTHSCYSDGTFTPEELLAEADKIGLSAIALCDHNTVAGLDSFLLASKNYNVEAIPAIELSTDWKGRELHVVGLYIQKEHYAKVGELLDGMRREKEKRYRECVDSLRRAGYNIDYDELSAECLGQANRAHIAMALVRGGYVSSREEAFASLIATGGEHYKKPKYLDTLQAIRFLKSIGAIAVLAHPYLSLDDGEVVELLPEAVAAGLDAMETIYPRYDEQSTRLAKKRAREAGILESGGSDFHGSLKPDVSLGVGRGNIRVPKEVLDALKTRL